MKNLKLLSFIGLWFMFLLSCQNGDEPKNENNVILNYADFGESIKSGSLTPISVTVYVGSDSRDVCISEKRDSLELVMNDYDYYRYYDDKQSGVRFERPLRYGNYITFYGLKPATTYYYFATEDGYNPGDPRKISPLHSFKTEDINLYVSMGSCIEWCGVNYLENRGEFHWTQFLSTSLFSYKELPNPSLENIEGDWRYPTKQELQELSETCTVTMVDFNKDFVRMTNSEGINLYIPFSYNKKGDSWTDGYKQLMLIPADDDESGIYVLTPNLNLSKKVDELAFGYSVKCGEELTQYKLKIEKGSSNIKNDEYSDFFHWSYLDLSNGNSQQKHGDEKRGVRFVREK